MSGGRTGSFDEDPDTGRVVIPAGVIEAIGGEIFGNLKKVVIRKYIGDNTNDRIIDLGVVCQLILMVTRSSFLSIAAHPFLGYVVDDAYGTCWEDAAGFTVHQSMASAASHIQGPMASPNETKVKLGTFGGTAKGWNNTGDLYTMIGLRFQEIGT